jgi:hypothetical protein
MLVNDRPCCVPVAFQSRCACNLAASVSVGAGRHSEFARQASKALESVFTVDGSEDSQSVVLVLGKQDLQRQRGVPWQLYCQVCVAMAMEHVVSGQRHGLPCTVLIDM